MSAKPDILEISEPARTRPLLKWAGGKTQLIPALTQKLPSKFGRYIEPFFGGGALYFHLQPDMAVIADSNPELINLYRTVANNPRAIIQALARHDNTEKNFYETRCLDWTELEPHEAAARTLFLNRTCFNGLYRVNKRGEFNTPFGRHKNVNLVDKENLFRASILLQSAEIRAIDYYELLSAEAKFGDFIYLDPPYLPIGIYSDFKRYTKDFF